MSKNTRPCCSKANPAAVVPWLWDDVNALLDNLSVRLSKKQPRDPDAQIVHSLVERLIEAEYLAYRDDYAIPLRAVYCWLCHPETGAPNYRHDRGDFHAAQRIIVNALNAEGSGLDVVSPRRLTYAS